MPDKVLGLDIGSTSIKAVEVTGGLRGYQVTACTRIEIDQAEGLEGALGVLFEKIPFTTGTCITSFPANGVSFRNLSMPFSDKKKITQTIGYELEPMLPFPIEEMVTDYIVAGRSSEETSILSASIPRQALERHLAILSAHNVDPDVVDVGGVSLAVQLAKDSYEPSRALHIDMGSRATSVIFCANHAVSLVRSFHFGGEIITEHIAKSKGVNLEEAEKLKCGENGGRFADIIRPPVQSLCREIQNTLHAFRCEVMKKAKPEKVFLTGGGALCPGIVSTLEECLALPTEPIDLARHSGLEMGEHIPAGWNPMLMNSALALALRDNKNSNCFNFRTGEFSKTKKYDQFRQEIKRIAIYTAIIFTALALNVSTDYYVTQKHYNNLQEQIASIFKETFPGVQRVVDPVHQMRTKIREAKESMLLPSESIVQRKVVDLLRDITIYIPKTARVDVSSLVIDEERVRLKGHTDSFNTVDAIKNGLQESSYFRNVAIGSAQLDRTGDTVRFELIMEQK